MFTEDRDEPNYLEVNRITWTLKILSSKGGGGGGGDGGWEDSGKFNYEGDDGLAGTPSSHNWYSYYS